MGFVVILIVAYIVATVFFIPPSQPLPLPTPSKIPTATSTAVPCPPFDSVKPEHIAGLNIYFYCDVSPAQQDLVRKFAAYEIDSWPKDVQISANIHVFADYKEGAKVANLWLTRHGHLGLFKVDTLNGDAPGITYSSQGSNTTFLYFNPQKISGDQDAYIGMLFFHETHHLLQSNLAGGVLPSIKWMVEGGADAFARRQLKELGIKPATSTIASCSYTLGMLESANMSVQDEACYYNQGADAVDLLLDLYGAQHYTDFFRAAARTDVSDAFSSTFGMTLEDFYSVYAEKYPVSIYPTTVPTLVP